MSRGVKISLGLVVVAIIGVVAMKMKGGSDKPVEVRRGLYDTASYHYRNELN